MKGCKRFFEHMYINPRGDVRICSWNNVVIGNIVTDSIEDIWNGDKRKMLLDKLAAGERYECREAECPLCLNGELTEMSEEEIAELRSSSEYPVEFNCAYDYRCNHVCPSCRHEIYTPDSEYKKRMQIISDKIGGVLPKAKRIFLNGSGDLFANPETMDMLSRLKPENPDFSMLIETNGTLFKDGWPKISHLAPYIESLVVTVNSYDRRTYAYLEGRDNLSALLENLEFIKELKTQYPFKLTITMVVQDSNFRQIPEFIDTSLNKYNADRVVLRSIFKWFQITQEEYMYKNVLNPDHIYHKEFLKIMEEPICSDPRVRHWGTRDSENDC